MRSCLVIRADQEIDVDAALSCGAHSLAFDLGSLDGAGRERARAAARHFLIHARKAASRAALYVCVAPVESQAIDRDLEALVPAAPDGVCLARACGGASVQHLAAKLAVHEAEAGRADGATRIMAMTTQTPAAIFGLGSYASASSRLAALAFDMEELCVALGATTWRSEDGGLTPPFALARALTLFGAAASQVMAIDAPLLDVADEEGLRAECLAARRDGFAGKIAVHPAQVRVINEAFADLDITA